MLQTHLDNGGSAVTLWGNLSVHNLFFRTKGGKGIQYHIGQFDALLPRGLCWDRQRFLRESCVSVLDPTMPKPEDARGYDDPNLCKPCCVRIGGS